MAHGKQKFIEVTKDEVIVHFRHKDTKSIFKDCNNLAIDIKGMIKYLSKNIEGILEEEDGSTPLDRAFCEIIMDCYESGEEWIKNMDEDK